MPRRTFLITATAALALLWASISFQSRLFPDEASPDHFSELDNVLEQHDFQGGNSAGQLAMRAATARKDGDEAGALQNFFGYCAALHNENDHARELIYQSFLKVIPLSPLTSQKILHGVLGVYLLEVATTPLAAPPECAPLPLKMASTPRTSREWAELGISHLEISLEKPALLATIPANRYRLLWNYLYPATGMDWIEPSMLDGFCFSFIHRLREEKLQEVFSGGDSIPNTTFEAPKLETLLEAPARPWSEMSLLEMEQECFRAMLREYRHRDSEGFALVEIIRQVRLSASLNKSAVDSAFLTGLDELFPWVECKDGGAVVKGARAEFFRKLGQSDQLPDSLRRIYLSQAMEECKQCVDRYDHTNGGFNCRAVYYQLEKGNWYMNFPEVVQPGRPIPAVMTYQHVPPLHFKLIRLDFANFLEKKELPKSKQASILKLRADTSWTWGMPHGEDRFSHEMRTALPAVSPGFYCLVISHQSGLESESQKFSLYFFQSSSLVVADREVVGRGSREFMVVDRQGGHPVPEAILEQHYLALDSNYHRFLSRKQLDGEGRCTYPEFRKSGRRALLAILGSDTLIADPKYDLLYGEKPIEKPSQFLNLYTDRSIYRPGQEVNLKGIFLEKMKRSLKVLPGRKIELALQDANHTQIASQVFNTNAFGSFAGTFKLPESGLNGYFHLVSEFGRHSFRVEDYKRPKFEVVVDPLGESYRLGQQISVTGSAKTYAGSVVDGAKVRYKVTRNPGFWGWWLQATRYWRGGGPVMKPIVAGTAQTDAEGRFSICFAAIPESGEAANYLDYYDYKVEVQVTDKAGESHKAEGSVRIGKADLEIDLQAERTWDKARNPSFTLRTKTLAGRATPAPTTLKVFRLQEPDRVVLPGPQKLADEYMGGEANYFALFPHHAKANQANWRNWKRGEVVWETERETSQSEPIHPEGLQDWPEGAYELQVASEDSFGSPVRRTHRFQLIDTRTTDLPGPLAFLAFPDRDEAYAGEKVNLVMGSGFHGAYLLLELLKDDEVLLSKSILLDSAKVVMPIPVLPGMQGGFGWRVSMVREGHFFQEQGLVQVPYGDRELRVEFTTFRDKLLPGQSETWTVKLSRRDGKPVSAEVMATLYDASLDAIYKELWPNFSARRQASIHASDWNLPDVWRTSTWEEMVFLPKEPIVYYALPNFPQLRGFDFFPGVARGRNIYNSNFFVDDTSIDELQLNMKSDMPAEVRYLKVGKDGQSPIGKDAVKGGKRAVKEEKNATKEVKSTNSNSGYHFRVDSLPAPPRNLTIRRALQELAFFRPQLRTNARGEVTIKFTVPESLTRWSFRVYAHTAGAAQVQDHRATVTQKPLMVMPHLPRFLRCGDQVTFTARVSNLSDSLARGYCRLELLDAATMRVVGSDVLSGPATQDFSIPTGQSAALHWQISAPDNREALVYRIIAYTRDFSDGEEAAIPLLPNRTLVTETLPLAVKPLEEKSFSFVALQNSTSTTLSHHRLSLEFVSNPAWNAVLALPYLMEFPHECAEQTFSRYYANALAAHIVEQHPRIRKVLEKWKNESPETLLSNLERRPDLKLLLLEETPWVIQAHSQSERQRRVGMLMDLSRMADEQAKTLEKIQGLQLPEGGFPWFSGGVGSQFITTHIVAGMGHLRKLGVRQEKADMQFIGKAVGWMDGKTRTRYEGLKRDTTSKLNLRRTRQDEIHYLYARSFFPEIETSKIGQEALDFFLQQAMIFWNEYDLHTRAQIALCAQRGGHSAMAKQIIQEFRSTATRDEENGMYWESNRCGRFWYQAPIETQALLIEAFREIDRDEVAVEQMRRWLLKMKQLQDWKTTKATTAACYALLMGGTDYLGQDKLAVVTLGGKKVNRQNFPDLQVEAGTGQMRLDVAGEDVRQEMSDIKVQNPNKVPSWGAVYWQYFEDYDKVSQSDSSGMTLHREMYKKVSGKDGTRLEKLGKGISLEPGDHLTVRLRLEVKREMEFVHLKDHRPAGLEPMEQLSGRNWGGGLTWYQSPRDAATHFFFDRLFPGKYSFNYDLKVAHYGDFSGGLTQIECMYAPEFRAQSAGQRLVVAEKLQP